MSWYITGPHNLRSFLAANSTQNFFLIARRFSFLWHSQQKCWINILGQNDTIFDIGNGEGGNKEKIRKYREWISLHFLILSPFSISLFSLHFIFIFSFPLHFLAAMRKKFLVKFARESSASCEGLWQIYLIYHQSMIILPLKKRVPRPTGHAGFEGHFEKHLTLCKLANWPTKCSQYFRQRPEMSS